MNLRYLNRNNICEMNGTCVETGATFERNASSYPCFAKAFQFMNNNGAYTYDIEYKLHIRKNCQGRDNNFAVLSKQDMCRLLNSIKYIIPFAYNFKEFTDEGESWYILNMHLRGTRLQHKGLLMLSRMLFEYPHNMCGRDALNIRKRGKLGDQNISNMSLVNLYLLALSSMSFSRDESFIGTRTPELLSMDTLKKKLKIKNRKIISCVVHSKDYFSERVNLPGDTASRDSLENEENRYNIYAENLKRNLNA